MRRRLRFAGWARSFERGLAAMTRLALASGAGLRAPSPAPPRPPAPAARPVQVASPGHWRSGVALGAAGARSYWLFRPPGVLPGERLPLMVMLHGCNQDARSFALGTRMNRVAARERFFVLYPEQDRLSQAQGCWHWFDSGNGRADREAASIQQAIDQVVQSQPVDAARVAVAGLSAGASMVAVLAARYPHRFQALVMHSGIAPGAAHSALTALGAMRGRRTVPALPPLASLTPAPGSAPGPAADSTSLRPPLLVIHGLADNVVAASNAEALARAWGDAAGAAPGRAREVQRGLRHAMRITDFKHRGRCVVSWVVVHGLGHAWSGGAQRQPYSDASGPDASRMAWAFAAKQFRQQR